ncbi:MAG: hypothetical protein H0V88_00330 [Pyrinomonadaceae bacterium]|nr:hypothetical protein [Pyrinomonadaceae bacterium]
MPFAFMIAACGKRRPPLPPVERVPQRTELLSGAQRGNQVTLSWPAPRRNAVATSVLNINRIDVYRLAERPTDPLPLTEEQFDARSTLIGAITSEEIRDAGDTLTYTDTLTLAGEPVRLRYAVRFVNASGQRASFSNFLLVEPAARISLPPVISGVTPTERAVQVRWQAPTANIDGSAPPNVLGYNIYRTTLSQTERGQTPLNTDLIPNTEFEDRNFVFGDEYSYVVRAVSLGANGAQVESLNSNSITVVPADKFPPSAPTSLTIAAAPGKLSLFYPANPERDVTGYHIYRSTDPELPKERWTKLTRTPNPRTTYTDDNLESGKRYYYYLTAVDASGNVSQPSEVISEIVP